MLMLTNLMKQLKSKYYCDSSDKVYTFSIMVRLKKVSPDNIVSLRWPATWRPIGQLYNYFRLSIVVDFIHEHRL